VELRKFNRIISQIDKRTSEASGPLINADRNKIVSISVLYHGLFSKYIPVVINLPVHRSRLI